MSGPSRIRNAWRSRGSGEPRRLYATKLLLSFVGLLAERHAYGPGDGFEFLLWDDLLLVKPTLVSIEEKKELVSLIIRTDAWVSFNLEIGMLQLIDIDAWRIVLENRHH
jgi:hypothetical protein